MVVPCRSLGSSLRADNGNVNYNSSNANFPNVGGNYNNTDNAGLFYCNVNYNSTNSNSNIGSRLSYFLTLHPHWGGEGPGQPCLSAKHDFTYTRQYSLRADGKRMNNIGEDTCEEGWKHRWKKVI